MKENSFLKSLEDHVVIDNINNMPLAGVKNFIRSMQVLGRGRKDILDKIVSSLYNRGAFKDVKQNVQLLNMLTGVRA